MDGEPLFEVERIAGERQHPNGTREYLVQWKGWEGSDTWEPEEHLVNCAEALGDFRLWQAKGHQGGVLSGPRWPLTQAGQQLVESLQTGFEEAGFNGNSQGTGTTGMLVGTQKLRDIRVKAALKSAVPVSPLPEKPALDSLEKVCPKMHVHLLTQDATVASPPKVLLSTRCAPDQSKTASSSPVAPLWQQGGGPESVTGIGCWNSSRKPALAGPVRSTRKVIRSKKRAATKSRKQALGTLARFSLRQAEGHYTYTDIVVRKQEGFTHIILSSKSSYDNCLNPGVMKEVESVLSHAAKDDSRFVLLAAVGNVFCGGVDLVYLSRRLGEDPARESNSMAESLQSFVSHFIHFRKPIVVAVDGPAMGLGAAILALCDLVWASDKAWFQTPYMTQGQTPDGCSSLTFPKIMGRASASEMLLSGRKLTAQEACKNGLVSQVLWPGTFQQEVMARVNELALCYPLALEEGKTLLCCSATADLEQANVQECEVLKRNWASPRGVQSIFKFLEEREISEI